MQLDQEDLPEGYSIRSMSEAEFLPLFREHRPILFPKTIDFNLQEALSGDERRAQQDLQKNMTSLHTLYLGVFCREEFVGWTFGQQAEDEGFYVRNSAIFPNHRKQGLYLALMNRTIAELSSHGFQIITSRHVATNNAVLIAKLKLGFVITGFDISDQYGVLVKLSYFFNPLRKKIMQFRSGELKPDSEVSRILGI